MEEFRKALLRRAKGKSMSALSRAFRIHDDDGNRTLSKSELNKALQACKIDLAPAEINDFWAALDRDGNGSITVGEFFRAVRGPMNNRRTDIVQQAFEAFDQTGDGVVTIEDLKDKFDAKRNPQVLKGDKTETEVLEEFLSKFECGSDQNGEAAVSITQAEFIDYYTGISASIEHDDHFCMLVTRAWKLDQPMKVKERALKDEVKSLFQASAYRSQRRDDAAAAADAAGRAQQGPQSFAELNANRRLEPMQTSSLNPFPLPKPGIVPLDKQGSYETTMPVKHHKTRCFRQGEEVIGQGAVQELGEGERTMTGVVPNGLPDAKGFLEATTSTQRGVGAAAFDDDVMAAHERGQQRIREAERKRLEAMSVPYQSKDPNMYARSSAVHCNMLPVAHATTNSGGNAGGNQSSSVGDGSNHNNSPAAVEPSQRAVTRHNFQGTGTMRPPAASPSALRKPAPASTSAIGWESTQHSHFMRNDPKQVEQMNGRWAKEPVPHPGQAIRAEAEQFIEEHDRRQRLAHSATSGGGGDDRWQTTYNATAVDPGPEGREAAHRSNNARGTFKLVNGVAQMNPLSHHPRQTMPGAEISPKDVVPGQFDTSTKTTMKHKR